MMKVEPEIDDALISDDDDASSGEQDSADETGRHTFPRKAIPSFNDENAIIILDPNEDPFTHGFVEHLIGAELGSDVEIRIDDSG